jgi:ABC-type Fe3+ transport system substrate-binding protein
MKLVKHGPHPNAAVVFANWFLTKEPQEIYQRTVATVSRRADVDLSGIPGYVIPKEGVEYQDTYTYAYIKETRPKLQKILGEILGR